VQLLGIYIHIPFCNKACNYCDFYFSTSLQHKPKIIDAIVAEIKRCNIDNQTIDTLYFGGGTPSLLSGEELDILVEAIHKKFRLSKNIETTIEVNPEDVNPKNLKIWRSCGINRVSLGVQSLYNQHLRWMNRYHSAAESKKAISLVLSFFDNVNVDLIYGLPDLTKSEWENTLREMQAFAPKHISAYCLTIENKTSLYHDIQNGKIKPAEEEEIIWQFNHLKKWANANDYSHYEISNFAKDDAYARHNTNYWLGKSYIGFGPSAHSFYGNRRWWNIRNNHLYAQKVTENYSPEAGSEILTRKNQINEYILTRIRTKWGLDLDFLKKEYQVELDCSESHQNGWIVRDKNFIFLTEKGMLFADATTKALLLT